MIIDFLNMEIAHMVEHIPCLDRFLSSILTLSKKQYSAHCQEFELLACQGLDKLSSHAPIILTMNFISSLCNEYNALLKGFSHVKIPINHIPV